MGKNPIRVAAITPGFSVPSARFRVRQYIPRLQRLGIELNEFYPFFGAYPPRMRWLRPVWAVGSLVARLPSVIASHRYDVTLLQREMLSTFVTLEPLTRRPRILDVDDAIWLRRGGAFARRLAQFSDLVICGNTFLAKNFSQWNSQVRILPTAVDTSLYRPRDLNLKQNRQIVGWSGTSIGFKYLYKIEPVLARILKKYPDAELWIVSDQPPKFHFLPLGQYKFIQWTPKNELMVIQAMTIGIMPLSDSVWERGKCSLKMLTYMACGIPVVVSRVGMNAEILSLGPIGFGTVAEVDWEDAIDYLLTHPIEAHRMGCVGREIVLRHFSVDVLAPKFGEYLRMVAR